MKTDWASKRFSEKAEADESNQKRAAPLLAFVLSMGKCVSWIKETLTKLKDDDIEPKGDNKRRLASLQKTKRELATTSMTLIALSLLISRVSRGNEVVTASLADFDVYVEGFARPTPLLAFALGDFGRPAWYVEHKWNGKKVKKFLSLEHDTLPECASALSVPDVMVACLKLIVALEPSYLDPKQNPEFRLLGHYEHRTPHAYVPFVDTNQLNDWLQCARLAPPRVIITTDKKNKKARNWLTSYSARNAYAKEIVHFNLLDERIDQRLPRAIKNCFGHTEDSNQVKAYASTTGHVSVGATEMEAAEMEALGDDDDIDVDESEKGSSDGGDD